MQAKLVVSAENRFNTCEGTLVKKRVRCRVAAGEGYPTVSQGRFISST